MMKFAYKGKTYRLNAKGRKLVMGLLAMIATITTVVALVMTINHQYSKDSIHMVQASSEVESDEVYTILYVVKEKDTLYRISRKYGVEVDEIKADNELTSDIIYIDQQLIINVRENIEQFDPNQDSVSMNVSNVVNTSYHGMNEEEYQVLLQVVQQEAGFDYESALWVMSTIMNRVESDNAFYADNIYDVITQAGQFESYGAGHHLRHAGNIDNEIERAVNEVLNGYRAHDYLFFWEDSYAMANGRDGVNVGGNVYFSDF